MLSFQLLLYRNAQAVDTFSNLIGWSRRKVQPHVATSLFGVAIRSIEAVARNKSYIFANGGLKQLLRVRTCRQRDPKEESTLGTSPCHFRGKVLGQGFQHHIAAFAIHAPDQLDVLIEKVVARHFM